MILTSGAIVIHTRLMENDGFIDLKATKKQMKWYFGLMKDRGFTGDQAKEMLKQRFDLDHLYDINRETMSYVIDRLLNPK